MITDAGFLLISMFAGIGIAAILLDPRPVMICFVILAAVTLWAVLE